MKIKENTEATKDLSIIVTAYGKPELLELCLRSIKKRVDPRLNYEIIVSSSATDEATYDLIREKFAQEVIFLPHQQNKGFGYVANRGIERARGKFLFIINHDIIIKDDAVQRLIDFLKKNPDVGLVGPRLVNFDGSIQNSAFSFYKWRTILYRRTFLRKTSFARRHLRQFLLVDKIKEGRIVDVDWLMGSALMTRAEAVRKVELFDERFFMYFEDVDWSWRFWQAGYRVVYNQEVTVAHYHGKASSNTSVFKAILFNKYTRIHIDSAIKFFRKHFRENNPRLNWKN